MAPLEFDIAVQHLGPATDLRLEPVELEWARIELLLSRTHGAAVADSAK